jgi:hypothetical chaperone protein
VSVRVGLDFGTSNSGVGLYDGRSVHMLPLDARNLMPEVVKTILYITREGERYIGQEAVEVYYRQNINRLRRFVKKWVGEIEFRGAEMFYMRDVYVYVDELQPGRLLQYLKTALRKLGDPANKGAYSYQGTQVFDQYYRVVDLVQAYLGALKQRAEEALGEKISGVTLGRPVVFNRDPLLDRQAEETLREAALLAGFEDVDFELEPIAAALFYEQSLNRPQTALIFDFGGGTLDIAILRLGTPHQRRLYASGGIDIAGSDFDRTIIHNRMLPHFGLEAVRSQPDLLELVMAVPDWSVLPDLSTPLNWHNLERAAQAGVAPVRLKALQALVFNDLAFSFYNKVEAAKIALSSQGAITIELKDEGIDLWELYTRSQFEKDIADHRQHIEQVLLATVVESGLEPEQIDAVVTTGGSSSIPLFQRMLGDIFGAEKVKASNQFSSVTAGLAIRAARNSHPIS